MRIAVLGANGQLGSDVAKAARRRGHEVLELTRADVDLEQLDAIPTALEPQVFDVLVNATGYHRTDEAEGQAQRAFRVNAHAVERLALVCAAKGARLVHVSTDYVFDGCTGRPYREEDPPAPINVYGASKLAGEALARRAYRDTLVVRVASLFGVSGASGKGGNFVETMIRVGREKGELKVVNDITMSPTFTADAAEALLALVEREAPAGVYHVVNSGRATWFEFARRIVERAGIGARVEPIGSDRYPMAARRPAFSVLDNSKVAALAGEMPPWEDALDRYLALKGYR